MILTLSSSGSPRILGLKRAIILTLCVDIEGGVMVGWPCSILAADTKGFVRPEFKLRSFKQKKRVNHVFKTCDDPSSHVHPTIRIEQNLIP